MEEGKGWDKRALMGGWRESVAFGEGEALGITERGGVVSVDMGSDRGL